MDISSSFLGFQEDPVSDAAIQDQVDILDDIPDDIYCSLVETLNDKCLETSLLEIWKYNEKMIKGIFFKHSTLVKYSLTNKELLNVSYLHTENSLQVLLLGVFPDLLCIFLVFLVTKEMIRFIILTGFSRF